MTMHMPARLRWLAAAALLLSSACQTGARAAEPSPVRNKWVDYQAMIHWGREEVSETRRSASEGDGFVPMFKARLTPSGRIEAEAQAGTEAPNSSYVALLAGVLRLDLPAASGGAWFGYYRDNLGWRWRHERIRTGARHVATNIDLRADTRSAAARLCLTVEIEPLAGATGETCRIEAIVDQEDGWPIAALIDRTQTGPERAGATSAVTLERLEPRMTAR